MDIDSFLTVMSAPINHRELFNPIPSSKDDKQTYHSAVDASGSVATWNEHTFASWGCHTDQTHSYCLRLSIIAKVFIFKSRSYVGLVATAESLCSRAYPSISVSQPTLLLLVSYYASVNSPIQLVPTPKPLLREISSATTVYNLQTGSKPLESQ